MFPDGQGWLICEFGGDTHGAGRCRSARTLMDAFKAQPDRPSTKLIDDHEQQEQLWIFRDEALGSTSKIPNQPDYYPGWEDSAVDPKRLGDYLRKFQAMMDEYGYKGSIYGHFGQGCVHVSINFDLFTADGIAKYREFVTKMAHICVEHGGSLSGEHGDGQARGELLPIMFGDELVQAFWEFKSIWDPQHKMNPGKVVHPYKLDQNLRWGTDYEPWEPQDTFHIRGRSRQLRLCGKPVRRNGEMPQARRRHDVPELHGDQGRGVLNARTGAPAVRDARRQSDGERLAGRRREGRAGLVPIVQGLQGRVPGQRRHGHV